MSKALVQRGHDVRIIMPLYGQIDRARYGIHFLRSCCVHFGRGEEIWVGIFEGKLDNEVTVWFVDYDRYFGRPWLYDGSDEDGFRFGVLSKAAMQICKDTGFNPARDAPARLDVGAGGRAPQVVGPRALAALAHRQRAHASTTSVTRGSSTAPCSISTGSGRST